MSHKVSAYVYGQINRGRIFVCYKVSATCLSVIWIFESSWIIFIFLNGIQGSRLSYNFINKGKEQKVYYVVRTKGKTVDMAV
jgi:hypothetical protein